MCLQIQYVHHVNVELDKFGIHATTCASTGDRVIRHSNLRNQCYQDCINAHLTPSLEKKINGTKLKANDVTIPGFVFGSDAYVIGQ